jgi:hypothetical protein
LKDGTSAAIRPIRPEDEPLMVAFHCTLSDSTVHFRYFGTLKLEERIAHERVMRKKASNILTQQIIEHIQESFAPLEPLGNDPLRISEVRRLMHNSTLMAHPNVIATPHIAFNSHEAIARINRATVDNINAFLCGAGTSEKGWEGSRAKVQ